jgi:TRAP-type C4-dicarboxylate transport system substrate-binding protein
MKNKLIWVLAHEPYDLFYPAAKAFKEELFDKTHGLVDIEIRGLEEYSKKYKKGQDIDRRWGVIDLLKTGEIDISTMYSSTLGKLNDNFYILDLPFLFRDHDHATSVLDGEIGKEILSGLLDENIKGLAFTYSGGFRILPSTVEIKSLKDLENLSIRVPSSPVAKETFDAIGAVPVSMPIEQLGDNLGTTVQAGETTYPRIYNMNQNTKTKFIFQSEHSLFLTSMLMNKTIWDNFDKDTQEKFEIAALNAARIERRDSLEDIVKIQQQAKKDGIQINHLSQEDKIAFQTASIKVHQKFEQILDKKIIDAIKRA